MGEIGTSVLKEETYSAEMEAGRFDWKLQVSLSAVVALKGSWCKQVSECRHRSDSLRGPCVYAGGQRK